MVRSLNAVTTPFTTVMHGTFSPTHPALPLTPLRAAFEAAVMIPLVTVRQAEEPLHPKVPLTSEVGVELVVVEPQPQVALDGIITKRARPD